MTNERDIKRRLSSGADAEPPAGLLEAIQQEIPEETFGPRITSSPELTGSLWAPRALAAAVVVLAAGLVAVGVARNGALPESVQPVPEVASAEAPAEVMAAAPANSRLRALGYLDAEGDSVDEARSAPSRRNELQGELRRELPVEDAASFRDAPDASLDADAASVRERLMERSVRTEASPRPVAPPAASPLEEAATPQKKEQKSGEESDAEREQESELQAKAAPQAAGSRASAELVPVEADDPAEIEEAESAVSEAVIASMETPAAARQVSAEELANESAPRRDRRRSRRAPAAPAVPPDSLSESRLGAGRVAGVETLEIVAVAEDFQLRARLEPGFRLEIENRDREWSAVPFLRDRLVRYDLDEGLLGDLRPDGVLHLRTVTLGGAAVAFVVRIPQE